MPRVPVTKVDSDELDRLWAANGVAKKRASGLFNDIIAAEARARHPLYHGGLSRIVKLLTLNGRHIGTVHEIVMPDGTIPHSHPKDYTLRDCSRIAIASEQQ